MPIRPEQLGDFFRRRLPCRLLFGERVKLARVVCWLVFLSVDVGERCDQIGGVPPIVL